MHNWSVDEEKLKKDPEAYQIWRLEQLVNYGLDGERIQRNLLEKYWDRIFIEDPHRRDFLSLLLWGKKS